MFKLSRRLALQNYFSSRYVFVAAESSSVARERGGGAVAPIGMSTKMQKKKNTTFLALLRLFYALKLTK